MKTKSGSKKGEKKDASYDYHHAFWTWHLYAGLFASPILMIVAITGALLVFDEETDRLLRPDLWIVELGETKLPDAQIADIVANTYPDGKVFSYRRPVEERHSYLFWVIGEDIGFIEVFVDPYTGIILGDRLREESLVRITEQLHRRLLGGAWGSRIVDLVTGWTIVLLLTGLYLWWPKNLRGLKHGLTIQFRGSAKKINWQLHNTIGFYSFALLLLLCLTGMVVSEVTGSMYRAAMFSAGAFPQAFLSPPKSNLADNTTPLLLDHIISNAQQVTGGASTLDVRFPQDAAGSFLVSTHGDGSNLSGYRAAVLDQYSGALIEELAWDQSHPLMKVRSLSLAIHFGSIYGLPTKILALLGCLVIPIICITGYLVWWWKRPQKHHQISGADQSPLREERALNNVMPLWLRACILFFFLVFPAVGASAICLAGYAWCRRRIAHSPASSS